MKKNVHDKTIIFIAISLLKFHFVLENKVKKVYHISSIPSFSHLFQCTHYSPSILSHPPKIPLKNVTTLKILAINCITLKSTQTQVALLWNDQ